MGYETLKRVMAALAGVAEAVGTLRALLPAGSDRADAVSQAVCELTDGLLEDAMLGEVGSPERTGAADKTPGAHGKGAAAAAPKAKGVRTKKAAAPAGLGEAGENDRPTPLCADCHAPFTRTAGPQKRCPECAEARKKTYKAEWSARRREETNPAATPERLAKIKAANERLDRIPEPGEGG